MAIPKQPVREKDSKGVEIERRRWPRMPPSVIPSLKSTRLLVGTDVQLLNVSRGGVLLETEARMIPGTTICIRLVAADAVFVVRGRVTRSRASLMRGTALLYESAIEFDELLPTILNDAAAAARAESAAPPQNTKVAAGTLQGMPSPAEDKTAEFTVTAAVPTSGPDIRQIFGLNRW